MGIVQNMTGFFISRFFLGVAESGLFPGVVYYFSMWYQRRERQFRISLIFGAAALAGSFGGILAYVSLLIVMPGHGANRAMLIFVYVGDWTYAWCRVGERLALDFHYRELSIQRDRVLVSLDFQLTQ
jgi:MFS family permease